MAYSRHTLNFIFQTLLVHTLVMWAFNFLFTSPYSQNCRHSPYCSNVLKSAYPLWGPTVAERQQCIHSYIVQHTWDIIWNVTWRDSTARDLLHLQHIQQPPQLDLHKQYQAGIAQMLHTTTPFRDGTDYRQTVSIELDGNDPYALAQLVVTMKRGDGDSRRSIKHTHCLVCVYNAHTSLWHQACGQAVALS